MSQLQIELSRTDFSLKLSISQGSWLLLLHPVCLLLTLVVPSAVAFYNLNNPALQFVKRTEVIQHGFCFSPLITTQSFLSNQRKSRPALLLRASLGLESRFMVWVHFQSSTSCGSCSGFAPGVPYPPAPEAQPWLSCSSLHPSQDFSPAPDWAATFQTPFPELLTLGCLIREWWIQSQTACNKRGETRSQDLQTVAGKSQSIKNPSWWWKLGLEQFLS